MSEWKECKLGDLTTNIDYGYTASAKQDMTNAKFLRITDITSKRVNWETVPHCDISDNNFKKYLLELGDIVIARTGATTGASYTIKSSDPKNVVFASYLIRYRINKSIADPFFIDFCLRSSLWQSYVDGIAGGSAQPGANAKQLANFEINLPTLPEQKAIAEVLTSLDDKIDLLQKQNKTLEQLAETLFRHHFIDNAKDDWEEKPLDKIADFLNGLACQKYPPKNEIDKLPVLKIKELRSGFGEDCDWGTTDAPTEYFVKSGDIIFSWSGSLLVKIYSGRDCILNQHLFKVTSPKYPKWFIYLWTKNHLEKFIEIAESKATTMGHIKRSDLSSSMVLAPSDDEIKEMDKIFTPTLEKIILNNGQISNIEKLRDQILPKLMSGEIRLN